MPKQLAESKSSRARPRSRYFKPQVQAFLREWIMANREWPYPSGSERSRIRKETRLSIKQIRIWMANARRVSPFTPFLCLNPLLPGFLQRLLSTKPESSPPTSPPSTSENAAINPHNRESPHRTDGGLHGRDGHPGSFEQV